VITKVTFSGILILGTSLGFAAPAGADPSVFNDLSCSCPQTVSNGGSSVADQIERGIRAGLSGNDTAEADE
jgi:hypothetical protein